MTQMTDKQKGFINYIVMLLLLAGLGVGLFLVSQTQVFRPKASEKPVTIIEPDGRCNFSENNGEYNSICTGLKLKFVSPLEIKGSDTNPSTTPPRVTSGIDAPTNLKGPSSKSVSLAWTNPEGVTYYQIQVTPYNNDGPGIDEVKVVAELYTFRLPDFGGSSPNYVILPDMTYTWKVRVSKASGTPKENEWSNWATSSFKTGTVSSNTIDRVAPQAQALVSSRTPTLTWSNSDKSVFYYEVQVSKDQSFGNGGFLYHETVHGGISSPINSYKIPSKYPLEPDTTYYWKVRPRIQGDGSPISWTNTFIFMSPQ